MFNFNLKFADSPLPHMSNRNYSSKTIHFYDWDEHGSDTIYFRHGIISICSACSSASHVTTMLNLSSFFVSLVPDLLEGYQTSIRSIIYQVVRIFYIEQNCRMNAFSEDRIMTRYRKIRINMLHKPGCKLYHAR